MSKMFKNIKEIIKENKTIFIWFLIIVLFVVIIDQSSKWLAYNLLGPLSSSQSLNTDLPDQVGKSVTIIPGFLNFTLLTNNGAAFGMGGNMMWSRILFILISWIVFIGVPIYLYFYLKKNHKFKVVYMIVASLIYGGNLGNLIDRTFYWNNPCGVIDFIDVSPLIPNFGVFNLADSALVIGIIILLIMFVIDIFKGDDDKKEDNKKIISEEAKKEETKVIENNNEQVNN